MKGDEHIRAVVGAWKARKGLNRTEAAELAHIKAHTLDRRLADPGTMTVRELRQIISATHATDDDVVRMITGRAKRENIF